MYPVPVISETYLLAVVNLSFGRGVGSRGKLSLESDKGVTASLEFRYLQGSRSSVLVRAGVLIAVIAALDWYVDLNVAFGFLYLFPILLVGAVLPRWQILATAFLCTTLSDLFSPSPFALDLALPQCILVFTSLGGTGLFVYEIARSRQRERENLRERSFGAKLPYSRRRRPISESDSPRFEYLQPCLRPQIARSTGSSRDWSRIR